MKNGARYIILPHKCFFCFILLLKNLCTGSLQNHRGLLQLKPACLPFQLIAQCRKRLCLFLAVINRT